ncbi:MAG: O-antigen translocase [Saprospiraceae bacterium]|nr:O-antigen translocase [Saprospiraceae bacterium]
MNFYKTSLYSGLFSVINLITGLVITKVTAKLLGPEGTAYIGKFANISGLILILSTASLSVGVVKYISDHKTDKETIRKIVRTAFSMILIGSIAGCIIILSSYVWLQRLFFNGLNISMVFILFGVFLLLISSQILVTGILNGLGEIKKLALINGTAAVLNMLFTCYFVYTFQLSGALFSNSLYGIFVTTIGAVFLIKKGYLNISYLNFKPDREIALQLLRFGIYAAITSFTWMITMFLIRENVEGHLDTNSAGLWQAMFSLSDRYLTVITNIMVIYFIPQLSSITESHELVREMRKAFKRIAGFMFLVCLSIWVARKLIISVFLADSFQPMESLFAYQMAGDFFKTCAGLLALLIASKAMFRTGLKADISFHVCLLGFSLIGVREYGLTGACMAYALACFFYLGIYLYFFKDLIVMIKKSVLPKPWFKLNKKT